MRALTPVLAGLTAIALAACGGDPSSLSADPTPSPTLRYQTTASVIEAHGKVTLCLGRTAASLPPGCGGVPLAGWDWSRVDGEQTVGNVTFGGPYRVEGSYDGTTFTLTGTPTMPTTPTATPSPDVTFPTPCEEPADGWPAQPAQTGPDDPGAALRTRAQSSPDFAGLWLGSPVRSTRTNSTVQVTVVGYTKDPQRHDSELREVYDGPLCLTTLPRTERALIGVQNDLHDFVEQLGIRFFSSGVDIIRSHVTLTTDIVRPDTKQRLDDKYGEGVVVVEPRLTPLP